MRSAAAFANLPCTAPPTGRRLQLFAGVTSGRLLWRCWPPHRLVIGLDPFGVKHTRFVDAFVSVRAEEVALRLEQIRRSPCLAITGEVSERGGKCRDGHG